MDKPKLLSGDELVARGTTKSDASLPEIGIKDVIPNGSWLEQKQVQSALEARKHLIEVERIEKRGSLSHAEWREELMLAEVTQQVSSHWQYIGHNVGKRLFLNPEEALFLLETNCLHLKYNDVTVSLQQAYSLLLRGNISLMKYKVYSYLSKLGYKIFRHDKSSDKKPDIKILKNEPINKENVDVEMVEEDIVTNKEKQDETTGMEIDNDTKTFETLDGNVLTLDSNSHQTVEAPESNSENIIFTQNDKTETMSNHINMSGSDINTERRDSTSENLMDITETSDQMELAHDSQESYKGISGEKRSKLQLLENRKLKACDSKTLKKHFNEYVPDFFQKHVVTVNIPNEELIPKNIFLNNMTYVLNLEHVRMKTKDARPPSRTYSVTEEVNGAHVRRVKDSETINVTQSNSNSTFQANTAFRNSGGPRFIGHFNSRFAGPRPFTSSFSSRYGGPRSFTSSINSRFGGPRGQIPPLQYWRPHTNMNFYNVNWLHQQPYIPSINFIPRYAYFPRPPLLRHYSHLDDFHTDNYDNSIPRKRQRDDSARHLEAIKKLVGRLKGLNNFATRDRNMQSLKGLVQTYNTRYSKRLMLTDQLELIDSTVIVETIELDCEDESSNKKARKENVDDKYEENLIILKQLALKLRDLECKNKASGRHRRALSSLIKKFNKSYNADVYMNSHYEIFNRRHITLDSSSDSDCQIEVPKKTTRTKKLRNPFNILRRLSKNLNSGIDVSSTSEEGAIPSTSKEVFSNDEPCLKNNGYSELQSTFNKNWLPDENDFGRAEIFPKTDLYNFILDCKKEQFLYDFIKEQPYGCDNWIDIKVAFLRNLEESTENYENRTYEVNTTRLNSLIGLEDYADKPSVLKKLNIIARNDDVASETSLTIDFDVYNRDVQNFRKSNRPKPHFRVICIDESSNFPTGNEVAALHSEYDDGVIIVFAIVGVGSVSYLQINPSNLPIYYIPSNDVEFT